MLSIALCLIAGFWIETRPSDFMDGTWDPLLYVSRRLMVEGANPADSGAVEFYARFDTNRDGYCDLVSADYMGPYLRLFFGSSTGFSDANVRLFSISYGGNCDMADLNLDNWPELIHSAHAMNECRIYWGSQAAGGPDPSNYTPLPHTLSEAVFVCDLNKDTYLDIILADAGGLRLLRVYWGGPGGYSTGDSSLRAEYTSSHNTDVADLNKDGYADIVLTRFDGTNRWGVTILWGDGDKNLSNNQVWFDWMVGEMEPHGITLGDFDRNGWLDIVVSCFAYGSGSPVSAIYFSDNGSFSPANRLLVRSGGCLGGSAAWDLNNDGWLDLIFFRGGAFGGAVGPLLLYRNIGTPPYFRDQDTVRIGANVGYSGGFIYDLNQDGKTDIFANVFGGNVSYVYWGVQPTGAYDSVRALSVNLDHHGVFRECGNIYDRSPYVWYESGVFSHANPQREALLLWVSWDSLQVGARVTMYMRTRWDPVSPWSAWRQVTNGELVNEAPYFPARDIQYRAEFRWRNPAWLPWLERVEIQTSPLYEDVSEEGKGGQLRFGSGKDLIWVSWPGKEAEVSLYSVDGRRIGSNSLSEGRAEFCGLRTGVYYLWINSHEKLIREKVVVR